MATTKTLTPTNQTITLAAFTEKPDNRINVTNDDRLTDAVNALNSNIVTKADLIDFGTLNGNETKTLSLSESKGYLILGVGTAETRRFILFVRTSGSSASVTNIFLGSAITYTIDGLNLNLTNSTAGGLPIRALVVL